MALPAEGILCEDLDRLAPEELLAHSIITLRDPENLTTEQVQRLRNRIYGQSRPVDANNLWDKLNNLSRRSSPRTTPSRSSSRRSSRSSSCTPVPSEGEREADAKEAYNDLLRMGGRPSRPIRLDPGVWSPSGASENLHVISHWWGEGIRFGEELDRWKEFRECQQRVRESPEAFLKWQETVLLCRQENGLEGSIELCLQPERQTKVDEWKEYETYWRDKINPLLRRLRKRLENAQNAFNSIQAEWDEVKLDQSKGYYERLGIENSVRIHRGRLSHAELELKRRTEVIDWIAAQLPLIAAETATSDRKIEKGGRHEPIEAEPLQDTAMSRETTTKCSISEGSAASLRGSRGSSDKPKPRSVLAPTSSSRVSKCTHTKATSPHRVQTISRTTCPAAKNHSGEMNSGSRVKGRSSTPGFDLRRSKRLLELHTHEALSLSPRKLLIKPHSTTATGLSNTGNAKSPPSHIAFVPPLSIPKSQAGRLASISTAVSKSKKPLAAAPRRSARIAKRLQDLGAVTSGLHARRAYVTTNDGSIRPTKGALHASHGSRPRGVTKRSKRKSALKSNKAKT